jgi:DNA-binding beta-propeller fold protein YncE
VILSLAAVLPTLCGIAIAGTPQPPPGFVPPTQTAACPTCTAPNVARPIVVSVPRLIATIPIGNPGWRVGVDPSRNRVYVTAQSNPPALLTAINGANASVAGTVGLGGNPNAVVAIAGSGLLYVGCAGNTSGGQALDVLDDSVDPPAIKARGVFPDLQGSNWQTASVNPTTNRLYWGSQSGNRSFVRAINLATTPASTIVDISLYGSQPAPAHGVPNGTAVDPTLNRVFVPMLNGDVFVIDGASNAVLGKVSTGHWPGSVAVLTSNHTVWVANSDSNTVSVFNGAANFSGNVPVQQVTVGLMPNGLAADTGTQRVFVANTTRGQYGPTGVGSVTILNADASVLGTLQLPSSASIYDIAVNSSTHLAYLPDVASPNVYVVGI